MKKKGECRAIIPKPAVANIKKKNFVTVPILADSPEFVPQYKTKGAACCDLCANLPENTLGNKELVIAPGHTELVDCGFSIAILEGYETQIRARSGLASKGIIVTNATEVQEGGTIDEDYRGRLKVILTNVGKSLVKIEHMDRIAQMSIRPCWYIDFEMIEVLPDADSDRVGGFGSTL